MIYLLSGIAALTLSASWGRAEERILTWDKGGDVVQLRLRMGGESNKAKGVIVLWGQHNTLPEYTNPEVLKEQAAWEQGARELGLGYCLADVVIGPKPTAELPKILSKLCQQGMKGYFPAESRWCLVATSLRALFPVQELMQFEHKRVAAWWPMAGLKWEETSFEHWRIPQLLTVASDDIKLEHAQKYWEKGRRRGAPWAWLVHRPTSQAEVMVLARKFFAECCSMGELAQAESLAADQTIPAWWPAEDVEKLAAQLQSAKMTLPKVVQIEVEVKERGPLQIYLRLPPGKDDARGVQGVMAYCTWTRQRDQLVQQLSYDLDQPIAKMKQPALQMLHYANKQELAVVTWSTPGRWNREKSFDQLTREERAKVDEEFDLYAAAWEKGIEQLIKEYGLPERDYLLYGMSRGAQWAHRLALRKPERFLAVNAHVSGSYDRPNPQSSRCLWLVTTGEFDGGREGAEVFYEHCLQLGYPILFKVGEFLGHSSRQDIETLRVAFFDYALDWKKRGRPAKTGLEPEAAQFVGDFIENKIVPVAQQGEVEVEQRVYFPNEELAKAWATPPPEE